VADTYNNAIRKYSPNGNGYLKQADVASTGLSNPYGVAVDSAGNVFVADTYNNAIRKYTPDGSGGYVKQADVVNSGLSTPFGVSVDSAGNVYIASTYSNHILRAVAQASVALASSSNPAPAGQNPVFTATVTPGNTSPQATGTVTFLDGSTQIGTAVLTSGQATLTGSALGFGTHYITARYEGDRDNAGATSSALALTVSSYAVTPGISAASPAGASTFTCADTVVPPGGGTTCTAVPATGYTLLALTGCDSVNLTTGVCGFTGVLANKTPVARFGLFLQGTTVPGAEAGTDAGGPASARVENGGPSCSFDPASTGFEAASAMPAGKLVPQGVFRFKLVGCTPGSTVRITTTWPQAVTDFAKYGKAASNAANASFFAPANLVISGNTVSFDVTDGQLGDDDWAQNGEIVDPVMPLSMAADLSGRQAIPTLSEWGLLLLALLSGALGAHGVTARRRRISLLRLNRMR